MTSDSASSPADAPAPDGFFTGTTKIVATRPETQFHRTFYTMRFSAQLPDGSRVPDHALDVYADGDRIGDGSREYVQNLSREFFGSPVAMPEYAVGTTDFEPVPVGFTGDDAPAGPPHHP